MKTYSIRITNEGIEKKIKQINSSYQKEVAWRTNEFMINIDWFILEVLELRL